MMVQKTVTALILGAAQMLFIGALAGGHQEHPMRTPPSPKSHLVVLPFLFYTPETKLAGGIGGLLALHTADTPSVNRPSSLSFYVIATQLKQFKTQWEPEIYFKREKYLFRGKITYEHYPNKFWGIGNGSLSATEERYTPKTISIEASLQKQILPAANLYGGFQLKYENIKILKADADGRIAAHEVAGSTGGTIAGIGFILNLDSRDDVFFPHRGDYWQLSTFFNSKAFGGDFSYASLRIDLRKYWPVLTTQILAVQGVFQAISGNPPFLDYAKLGSSGMMRGYYTGRYRDKVMVAVQTELRIHVWKRLGFVGFIGFGDVVPRFGGLGFGNLKYSAGAGLRYKGSAKESANIRLDFACGKKSSGLYLTAREAF